MNNISKIKEFLSRPVHNWKGLPYFLVKNNSVFLILYLAYLSGSLVSVAHLGTFWGNIVFIAGVFLFLLSTIAAGDLKTSEQMREFAAQVTIEFLREQGYTVNKEGKIIRSAHADQKSSR